MGVASTEPNAKKGKEKDDRSERPGASTGHLVMLGHAFPLYISDPFHLFIIHICLILVKIESVHETTSE